jgi:hypothetical protein
MRFRFFSLIVFTISAPLLLIGQNKLNNRPAWPRKWGAYIATSSKAIPLFPRALSGYRSEDGKDFWGKPFSNRGSIRVFKGNDWQGIPNFPNTMNGCSNGAFMIRWRSADSHIQILTSAENNASVASKAQAKPGVFGYMSGTNCEQPLFKFVDPRDGGTLVDVFYELKFWQAAP